MFYMDGVSWFIDVRSKLVGTLTVNAQTSMFSKRTTPLDTIDGRIVRVYKIYITMDPRLRIVKSKDFKRRLTKNTKDQRTRILRNYVK